MKKFTAVYAGQTEIFKDSFRRLLIKIAPNNSNSSWFNLNLIFIFDLYKDISKYLRNFKLKARNIW